MSPFVDLMCLFGSRIGETDSQAHEDILLKSLHVYLKFIQLCEAKTNLFNDLFESEVLELIYRKQASLCSRNAQVAFTCMCVMCCVLHVCTGGCVFVRVLKIACQGECEYGGQIYHFLSELG